MFFRFLIWTIFIYIMARVVWRVFDSLAGGTRQGPSRPTPEPPQPPKSTVEYKDVEDAKFVDVPTSSEGRPAENQDSK